jgi:hypothetical protein
MGGVPDVRGTRRQLWLSRDSSAVEITIVTAGPDGLADQVRLS